VVRLFSIEDHWVVIDGLKSKFRADRNEISITCSAENMEKALLIDAELFDVILLDLLIPGTDPLENVKKLQTRYPGKPIVIYSSEESAVWKEQMYEAGVMAYLTKHDVRKHVKEVIKGVYRGENFRNSGSLGSDKSEADTITDDFTITLKPTEKAILLHFKQDMSMKEISIKLNMTSWAVSKSMARLRKRFKVKTNQGLIQLLINRRLV